MGYIVDPAETAPLPYGLLSVVKPQNLTDSKMLMGIEYQSDHCYNGVDVVVAQDWCNPESITMNLDPKGDVEAGLVLLRVSGECASPGANNDWNDAADRVTRNLAGQEQSGLTYASGVIYTEDASASDVSPGGVATPLPAALATLTDSFGATFPWRGVLWAPTIAANYMASKGLLIKVGTHYETPSGHYVITSPDVRNYGPAYDTAGAGEFWMWMTAVPRVWRGVAEVNGPFMIAKDDENEFQTVSITGAPTGGTFTLTFDGYTTAAIPRTGVGMQAALEALPNIEPGDVVVTGSGPYTVEFTGQYAKKNVPQMTATSSLTGGTAPAVTVATDVQGILAGGDNTYRAYATRPYIIDFDCAAPKAILVDSDAL